MNENAAILRDRDALPRRPHAVARRRRELPAAQRPCKRGQTRQIDGGGDVGGSALEVAVDVGRLDRLHETQMALRQRQGLAAAMAPRTPRPSASMAGAIAISMARAASSVEDDAADGHDRRGTSRSRARRLPPSRPAPRRRARARSASRSTPRGPRSSRARVWPRPGAPSNRPITPSTMAEVRVGRVRGDERVDQLRAHRPACRG